MKNIEKPISLYFHPKTRATRVHWMLEELGVNYELVLVELSKGSHKAKDYIAIHPLGKVPTLKMGEEIILESMAICLYLADYYSDSNLSPEINTSNRAQYYQWMALSIGTLEPAIIEQRRYLKANQLGIDPIDMGPTFTPLQSLLTHIDNTLANNPFIIGEQFTAADIMIGSLLINAENIESFVHFKHIKSWLEQVTNRPAYQRAMTA